MGDAMIRRLRNIIGRLLCWAGRHNDKTEWFPHPVMIYVRTCRRCDRSEVFRGVRWEPAALEWSTTSNGQRRAYVRARGGNRVRVV
jgi:hypothetical protein